MRQVMLGIVIGVLVAGGFAACGTPIEPGNNSESQSPGGLDAVSTMRQALPGARLKIRYIEGADGSKQFIGWYDTKWKDSCIWVTPRAKTFGAIPSDAYYCATSNLQLLTSTYTNYYLDNSCTERFFVSKCALKGIPYTLVSEAQTGQSCGGQSVNYSCYKIGGRINKPQALYVKSGDSCVEGSGALEVLEKQGYKVFHQMAEKCTESMVFGSYVKGQPKVDQ